MPTQVMYLLNACPVIDLCLIMFNVSVSFLRDPVGPHRPHREKLASINKPRKSENFYLQKHRGPLDEIKVSIFVLPQL